MSTIRKSKSEAKELGESLRRRRRELGLTLKILAGRLGVDVGQLSRFERGDFTFISPNLQKMIDFMQIEGGGYLAPPELVLRFSELIQRSRRHEAAARALVSALEALE